MLAPCKLVPGSDRGASFGPHGRPELVVVDLEERGREARERLLCELGDFAHPLARGAAAGVGRDVGAEVGERAEDDSDRRVVASRYRRPARLRAIRRAATTSPRSSTSLLCASGLRAGHRDLSTARRVTSRGIQSFLTGLRCFTGSTMRGQRACRTWPDADDAPIQCGAALLTRFTVSHEHSVDVVIAAPIVPTPQSLALEPEPLVQLNRRLVPRKHVQLELPDAGAARPLDGRLQ
jgi:hypothetical protein